MRRAHVIPSPRRNDPREHTGTAPKKQTAGAGPAVACYLVTCGLSVALAVLAPSGRAALHAASAAARPSERCASIAKRLTSRAEAGTSVARPRVRPSAAGAVRAPRARAECRAPRPRPQRPSERARCRPSAARAVRAPRAASRRCACRPSAARRVRAARAVASCTPRPSAARPSEALRVHAEACTPRPQRHVPSERCACRRAAATRRPSAARPSERYAPSERWRAASERCGVASEAARPCRGCASIATAARPSCAAKPAWTARSDRSGLTTRPDTPSLISPAVGWSARYRCAGTIVPGGVLASGWVIDELASDRDRGDCCSDANPHLALAEGTALLLAHVRTPEKWPLFGNVVGRCQIPRVRSPGFLRCCRNYTSRREKLGEPAPPLRLLRQGGHHRGHQALGRKRLGNGGEPVEQAPQLVEFACAPRDRRPAGARARRPRPGWPRRRGPRASIR